MPLSPILNIDEHHLSKNDDALTNRADDIVSSLDNDGWDVAAGNQLVCCKEWVRVYAHLVDLLFF